jgi:hypothetical protein
MKRSLWTLLQKTTIIQRDNSVLVLFDTSLCRDLHRQIRQAFLPISRGVGCDVLLHALVIAPYSSVVLRAEEVTGGGFKPQDLWKGAEERRE